MKKPTLNEVVAPRAGSAYSYDDLYDAYTDAADHCDLCCSPGLTDSENAAYVELAKRLRRNADKLKRPNDPDQFHGKER